ncbi:hypothetical protein [Chryseobacterium sp. M5A1_1a]
MDFQTKNKQLKYIGIVCFIISLLLPVPIPMSDGASISFDDVGIWYLLFGWMVSFTLAGISWWANVFLILSWFNRKNLTLSLVFIGIAVFLALTFIVNAHSFQTSMGIVGGSGNSSLNVERALPGVGYAFWLASLIIFLLRARAKFLRSRKKDQSTI